MLRPLALVIGIALSGALLAAPAPAEAAEQQFTLTAAVDGLYPNADVAAPVTVHNPLGYPIAVHTADILVGDASVGCSAANVVAGSFAGDVTIPSGGTTAIPIEFRMRGSAPNACQGATFPLTLVASGEPATIAPTPGDGGNGDEASPRTAFAFTGSDSVHLVLVGTAAIGAGTLVAFATRRREGRT